MDIRSVACAAWPVNSPVPTTRCLLLSPAPRQREFVHRRWSPANLGICIKRHRTSFSFTYNLAGDLLTLTDANANVTTSYTSWNDLGLLTDITYNYDTFGNRTGMTDALSAIGSTSWTYNANGDILTEDGPFTDDTVTYTYASGRKSGMAFSDLETSYAYDPMSRVSGVTASNGEAPAQALALSGVEGFAYTFLARSNKVAGVTLNGGPSVAHSFDDLGRLTQKTNTFGQTTVSSYQYQLNDADQRVLATFADGKYTAYSYDAAGQLLSAQRHFEDDSQDYSYNYAYTFDPMGNPATKATQGQQRTYTANACIPTPGGDQVTEQK